MMEEIKARIRSARAKMKEVRDKIPVPRVIPPDMIPFRGGALGRMNYGKRITGRTYTPQRTITPRTVNGGYAARRTVNGGYAAGGSTAEYSGAASTTVNGKSMPVMGAIPEYPNGNMVTVD